jgi:acetylornithine deacetylase
VHASLVSGGQELSSYPAECRLELERRTLPGDTDDALKAEMDSLLEAARSQDPDFRASVEFMSSRLAYEIAPDAAISVAAARAAARVLGNVEHCGMSFWTDTALLQAAGIPGVVFGPSGRGLHGKEEYVELDSLTACAEVLRELALDWCG